jgi:protein-L-isoaspartate(D-aspartate) O-methyltransferase
MTEEAPQRRRMVARDIVGRGVTDERVIAAMRAVPREFFVGPELSHHAYDDTALPIGEGQTISQPYIVASMAAAATITSTARVLEVGTGSGYGAAVLGQLAGEVYTIERHRRLADDARDRIAHLGYRNVHVVVGDGTLGLPDLAPFDAIVVTAAAPAVPDALVRQLATTGSLVIPVGPDGQVQHLLRIRRCADAADALHEDDLGAVRFVPLIGELGWDATSRRAETGPT